MLSVGYSLGQCIKSADLLTPAYRDYLENIGEKTMDQEFPIGKTHGRRRCTKVRCTFLGAEKHYQSTQTKIFLTFNEKKSGENPLIESRGNREK